MPDQNDQLQNSLEDSQNPDSQTQNPPNPPPAGSDTISFEHPALKGKSPAEIENFVRTLESANREQGSLLNEHIRNRQDRQDSIPAHREAPPQEEDPAEFFKKPRAYLREMINEAVAPLQNQINRVAGEFRAPSLREDLRREKRYFTQLEPTINLILQKRGITSDREDRDILETVYKAVLGDAFERGLITSEPAPKNDPPPPPPRDNVNRNNIPQHRPSPAPLPKQPGADGKPLRDLTENERRLAREYNMTEAQYIAYQDAEDNDVLTFEVPK